MASKRTFEVPGEIAAAVLTSRESLVNVLRGRIERGEPGLRDAMLGVCDLVEQAIIDSREEKERRRKFVNDVNTLRGDIAGFLRKLDEMVERHLDEDELPREIRDREDR